MMRGASAHSNCAPMKRVIALGLTLVASCALELPGGGEARCDERTACAAGLACYRGYCIPSGSADVDEVEPNDAASWFEPPQLDATVGANDAGAAPPPAPSPSTMPSSATIVMQADAGVLSPSGTSATPTASAPVDAGPGAASSCTLQECCDQANLVLSGSGGDAGKDCGCDNIALLLPVTCIVVPRLGWPL